MKKFPKPWFRPSRNTWYVTLDGSQIDLGRDKESAFEQYKALLAKPRWVQAAGDSLAGVIDTFLEWNQKHRSAATYEWYRYRLQRFIERFPDLRINELRPYHAQQWVDSYGFSQTSPRNYLRTVKRCLIWAMKQGYITQNPLQHLEIPSAEPKEVLVTQSEYDELLTFVPEGPFRDLIVVTWESGCRPQESLKVEARHVDEAHQRWVFPRSESKGKRTPRVVYLTDVAMQVTLRLLREHPTGHLFRNTNGMPWTTEAVNCAFDRLQVRMGKVALRKQGEVISEAKLVKKMKALNPNRRVKGRRVAKSAADLRCEAKEKLLSARAKQIAPRYSLYALRHSWATRALQRGTDALTVAILMGHSDPSTLAKVYQHLAHNPGHLLEQAKKPVG